MSAYPLDAVSAAGPLCTHGKDKPGLGAPNSLKLLLLRVGDGGAIQIHTYLVNYLTS